MIIRVIEKIMRSLFVPKCGIRKKPERNVPTILQRVERA